MRSTFQERFKGKTSLMTKQGVEGVIRDSDNPIAKQYQSPQPSMDELTSHQRYANQKREAQTFDSSRPFFNPEQQVNVYSYTQYQKPPRSGSTNPNNLYHTMDLSSGINQREQPHHNQQPRYQSYNHSATKKDQDSLDRELDNIKQTQAMQSQFGMHSAQKMPAQSYTRPPLANNASRQSPFEINPGSTGEISRNTHWSSNGQQVLQGGHSMHSASNQNLLPTQQPSKKFSYRSDDEDSQQYSRGALFSTGRMTDFGYQKGSAAAAAVVAASASGWAQYDVQYQQQNMQGTWQKKNNDAAVGEGTGGGQNFKPYTLKEYKNLQKAGSGKPGGLGPNIGNDQWTQKKEQTEKRNEFAKQIQSINSQVLRQQQEAGQVAVVKVTKEISAREKALEFARKIPKPVIALAQTAPSTSQSQQYREDGESSFDAENDDEKHKVKRVGAGGVVVADRNRKNNNNQSIAKQKYNNDATDLNAFEQNHLDYLNQIEKIIH